LIAALALAAARGAETHDEFSLATRLGANWRLRRLSAAAKNFPWIVVFARTRLDALTHILLQSANTRGEGADARPTAPPKPT
jgi:hypothetical protein